MTFDEWIKTADGIGATGFIKTGIDHCQDAAMRLAFNAGERFGQAAAYAQFNRILDEREKAVHDRIEAKLLSPHPDGAAGEPQTGLGVSPHETKGGVKLEDKP